MAGASIWSRLRPLGFRSPKLWADATLLRQSTTSGVNGKARFLSNAKPDPPAGNSEGIRGFIDDSGGAGAAKTGRSWRTSELRLKSFEDLHRLWYVLARERNILLTEKEWCRSNGRHWLRGESNLYKIKRSMARLQTVVSERTRAYKARQNLQRQGQGLANRELGIANRVKKENAKQGL